MTLPRRRLWRIFFGIAALAILVEVLVLTSTFVQAVKRRVGNGPGLVSDQIVAVVHLWPTLNEPQRKALNRFWEICLELRRCLDATAILGSVAHAQRHGGCDLFHLRRRNVSDSANKSILRD